MASRAYLKLNKAESRRRGDDPKPHTHVIHRVQTNLSLACLEYADSYHFSLLISEDHIFISERRALFKTHLCMVAHLLLAEKYHTTLNHSPDSWFHPLVLSLRIHMRFEAGDS